MLKLDLATIAKATNGRLHGASVTVRTVSTDSRKRVDDALFVALHGALLNGSAMLWQSKFDPTWVVLPLMNDA